MIFAVAVTKERLGWVGMRWRMIAAFGCLVLLFLSLSASAEGGERNLDKLSPATVLSTAAQQRLAATLFEDIYKLSGRTGEEIVAQKIALYRRIIKRCPDVPLAQESYWHLLETMMMDVQPPRKEESLRLYAAFNRRYPQSKMRNLVSHQMMKSLYQQGQWLDLERIASQYLQVTTDKENGAPSAPVAVFLRAEARYRLGSVAAAEKGYGKILQYFPQSRMATVARARMAETGIKAKAEN